MNPNVCTCHSYHCIYASFWKWQSLVEVCLCHSNEKDIRVLRCIRTFLHWFNDKTHLIIPTTCTSTILRLSAAVQFMRRFWATPTLRVVTLGSRNLTSLRYKSISHKFRLVSVPNLLYNHPQWRNRVMSLKEIVRRVLHLFILIGCQVEDQLVSRLNFKLLWLPCMIEFVSALPCPFCHQEGATLRETNAAAASASG